MKKIFGAILIVLTFLCLYIPCFAEDDGWLENLDEGIKQAKKDNKRVFVDFTATWCKWCLKLKDDVFSKDNFKNYARENLVLVSIDADQNRELVDKYQVNGFPTMFILDSEGKVLATIAGYIGLEACLEQIKATENAGKKESSKSPKKQ